MARSVAPTRTWRETSLGIPTCKISHGNTPTHLILAWSFTFCATDSQSTYNLSKEIQELLKVREPPWISERQPADLPSLRFSLANPGLWLLESSEELLKEEAGSADASGWSQLSVGKTPAQVSTIGSPCTVSSLTLQTQEQTPGSKGSHGAHSMGRPGEHRALEACRHREVPNQPHRQVPGNSKTTRRLGVRATHPYSSHFSVSKA